MSTKSRNSSKKSAAAAAAVPEVAVVSQPPPVVSVEEPKKSRGRGAKKDAAVAAVVTEPVAVPPPPPVPHVDASSAEPKKSRGRGAKKDAAVAAEVTQSVAVPPPPQVDASAEPKKRRNKKEKRVPKELKPKKMSGYNLFLSEKSKERTLSGSLPIKLEEHSKMVGAQWKEMSEEKKAEYNKRAEEANVAAVAAAAAAALEPPKPKVKRAPSAYIVFSNTFRPSVQKEMGGETVSFGKLGKELGDRWRALTDEQKQYYSTKEAIDASEAVQTRYRAERDAAAASRLASAQELLSKSTA